MSRSKYFTIYNWKKSGLIYDDYDELYEVYIKTMNCGHCNKAFKNSSDRCLDHNHETGLFRKIVCHKCNVWDSYIKYPNGYSKQEYGKEYYQKNKDKLSEYYQEYYQKNKQRIIEQNQEYWQKNKAEISSYKKEKIKCECGSIVGRSVISRHNRTKKHTKYLNSI